MGEEELTFRIEEPSTGRDDLLLVRFEGDAMQTRKFAAGILAVGDSALVEYRLNDDAEEAEKAPKIVNYRMRGHVDAADSVWVMPREKGPITKEHRAAVEFDAAKAAEIAVLKAKIDIIAHRQRKSDR